MIVVHRVNLVRVSAYKQLDDELKVLDVGKLKSRDARDSQDVDCEHPSRNFGHFLDTCATGGTGIASGSATQ